MGLPDFKALKERVGIDDVAYYLGYQVNRQAGVGRFIEMVLPDGSGGWLKINATREKTELSAVANGQAVLIVIGDDISRGTVDRHLCAVNTDPEYVSI